MIRAAYIVSPRGDWVWFLGLPFAAVAAGYASQLWLSAVAVVSFSLWITAPRHFATWLRAYGVPEDRRRWREPLLIWPIAIALGIAVKILWAPLTLLPLVWAWDHQHSVMQQYGFARFYDHKASTGTPLTARFDLGLNCVLYANLMIVSPLYSEYWIRESFRFGFIRRPWRRWPDSFVIRDQGASIPRFAPGVTCSRRRIPCSNP